METGTEKFGPRRLGRCGVVGLMMLAATSTLQAGDWWVTLGPIIRHNMEVEVEGRSHVQNGTADIPSAFHRGASRTPLGDRGAVRPSAATGVLPLTGFADRAFDDGFVNIGSTTGVGGSLASDYTWFWGYDNASQVDTNANTVSFNREVNTTSSGDIVDVSQDTRRTIQVLRDEAINEEKDLTGFGLELLVGRDIHIQTGRTVSVIGGINALWGDGKKFHSSPWAADVRTRQVEVTTEHAFSDTWTAQDLYTYLLQDPAGNPLPPRAPGSPGTFNGLPLPSPLIPNVPDSYDRQSETLNRASSSDVSRRTVSDRTTRYWNEVDLDVDTKAFQLFTGLQAACQKEKAEFFVSGRATLNFLEIDVERNEVLVSDENGGRKVIRAWRDQADDTEVALGLGLSAGGTIYFDENWFIRGEYGYDFIFGEAEVKVGPNKVEFDASGFSAKLSLGRDL